MLGGELPSHILKLLAVLAGRQPDPLFEQAPERVAIFIAHLQGDLLEGLLAAFQEELGFFQAQVLQVFDGGLVGGFFEAADEVAHAQAEVVG